MSSHTKHSILLTELGCQLASCMYGTGLDVSLCQQLAGTGANALQDCTVLANGRKGRWEHIMLGTLPLVNAVSEDSYFQTSPPSFPPALKPAVLTPHRLQGR